MKKLNQFILLVSFLALYYPNAIIAQTTYNRHEFKMANSFSGDPHIHNTASPGLDGPSVTIGPVNGTVAQFSTSASSHFLFNKDLRISTGNLGSNSGNLSLRTGATTRMTVTSGDGFVGLGTTSPGSYFHVHGTQGFPAPIGGGPAPGGTQGWIQITNTESGTGAGDGLKLGMAVSTAMIGTTDNLALRIFNNSDANMSMFQNGKINFFDISGSHDAKIAMIPLNNNGLLIDNTGLTSGYSLKVKTNNNAVQAFTVYSGSTGKYVVKGDGQVGIGTVLPAAGYMLDVAGKIRSCEVKVSQTSWCDFVFAPDYPLLSLSNLKEYINENRHLPEMPSEAEVLENEGFEVSKMTQALLQRAEENTLYIIALEEKNAELQNKLDQQNADLEARIAALEKKLEEVLLGK